MPPLPTPRLECRSELQNPTVPPHNEPLFDDVLVMFSSESESEPEYDLRTKQY